MKNRTEIKKMALSAICCALSAAICFLGNILNIADLTACAAASGLLYIAKYELSSKYPILIYAVTSALLLVLFPTASATVFYIAFFGYYPIIKNILERLPKPIIYIVKLLLFNGILLLLFRFAKYLFIAESETVDNPLLIAALLLANVFFFVFDIALSFFGMAYEKHYRRLWGIDKLMR